LTALIVPFCHGTWRGVFFFVWIKCLARKPLNALLLTFRASKLKKQQKKLFLLSFRSLWVIFHIPINPEISRTANGSARQPRASRSSPEQPRATQSNPDQPRAIQSGPELHRTAQRFPAQPKALRSSGTLRSTAQGSPDQPRAIQSNAKKSEPVLGVAAVLSSAGGCPKLNCRISATPPLLISFGGVSCGGVMSITPPLVGCPREGVISIPSFPKS
jgi:hypothetical protein